jgi:hypothetical protein
MDESYVAVESVFKPGELTLSQHKDQVRSLIRDYDSKVVELFASREVALRRLARLQSELSALESLPI